MAQSILNVNIQPGGNAIYKRDGYGLFQNLVISSGPVHGGYHFQQLGGNDVQIWGNDVNLNASVTDAAFVKVATGTLNATWQCTDSQGKAYCFSSSGDTPVITDGTSANTTYNVNIPAGTMGTFTPLQLVVAGVSGNTNTIYISAQNSFLNFTVGILPSSSFTEPIAAPGSRITHLAYYFGRLFWWKDQSFGFATFTGQNDWQLTIVSNQIGTLDNSDAFWNSSGFDAGTMFSGTQQANANASPGGIFFRGQDNHIYVYDGYYLTRLSRIITPTVTASNRKKANSWAQTTQADFNGGLIVPSQNLSTSLSPGDIIVSSFSVTENSSTSWAAGSTNSTTVFPSSITLSLNNSGTVTNPDYESAFSGNWTVTGNSGSGSFQFIQRAASGAGNCGTINPQNGSNMAGTDPTGTTIVDTPVLYFEATNTSGNTTLQQQTLSPTGNICNWVQATMTPTSSNIGKRVRFRLHRSGPSSGDTYLITSDSYIWGGPISLYFNSNCQTSGCASNGGLTFLFADNISLGSSTITSGSFTSQIYNTGFTSATYTLQTAYNANTSTPTFALQTSTSSTGVFTSLLTSTGTNAVGNQYARYVSTISIAAGDNALTSISSAKILALSTGTYYSAVNNAPNLTGWGTFAVDFNYPGISSVTYYVRSSTGAFAVSASTPAWALQTVNGTVNYSTYTYMQMRADFYLSAATETPTINDFTFNWFEGSAADKAYMTYYNDAIWFSMSSSTSSANNNTIFYWDLLNGAWGLYDIPANGLLIENNSLYFGSPTTGAVYKFGGVTSDNGASINSYWKSKDFLGNQTSESSSNGQSLQFAATDDLFVQKEFTQADFILGESSTTLTYTYTLDSKTSTAYVITAYDSAASLIQRNFLLPVGKIGKYYNFQISNNSTAQKWTFMGHRVLYNALNWRPVLN